MIYCDVHGVLADFITPAQEVMGIIPHVPDRREIWEGHMTEKEMLARIQEHVDFWEDLPVYPWAHELVAGLRELAPVIFVSRPGPNAQAATGTVRWLEKHNFIEHGSEDYILTRHKERLANPRTLLIDDWPLHIEAFQKAGGKPWLFQQPWNTPHASGKPKTVDEHHKLTTTKTATLLKEIIPYVYGSRR